MLKCPGSLSVVPLLQQAIWSYQWHMFSKKVCSGCQTTNFHSASQTTVPVWHHQEALSHRLFILDIVRHLTDSWPGLFAGCVAAFSHVITFGTLYIPPTSLCSYWAPGPLHAVFGDANPFLRPSPSHVTALSSSDNLREASPGNSLVCLWGSDHDITRSSL